jgi:hypothetical protein
MWMLDRHRIADRLQEPVMSANKGRGLA